MGKIKCRIWVIVLTRLTPRICDALPLSRERGAEQPRYGCRGEY